MRKQHIFNRLRIQYKHQNNTANKLKTENRNINEESKITAELPTRPAPIQETDIIGNEEERRAPLEQDEGEPPNLKPGVARREQRDLER